MRHLAARKRTMNNVAAKYSNKALITFFIIVIILSLAAEAFIILDGPGWLYLVLMWIPAFSAIVASVVSRKDNKNELSLKGFLPPAVSERMYLAKALVVTGLFWACWQVWCLD